MSTTDMSPIVVTPVGGAGTSEGTTTSAYTYNGLLSAIYVEYAASSAATTVVTITSGGLPVLTLTSINTSGWYPVQLPAYGLTGSALTGVYVPRPITAPLVVTVTLADNNKTVTVYPFVVK